MSDYIGSRNLSAQGGVARRGRDGVRRFSRGGTARWWCGGGDCLGQGSAAVRCRGGNGGWYLVQQAAAMSVYSSCLVLRKQKKRRKGKRKGAGWAGRNGLIKENWTGLNKE
jgi:hypothetical protein